VAHLPSTALTDVSAKTIGAEAMQLSTATQTPCSFLK